ncbi:GNAT family N-acetyltransferase [Marinigracilibium pacificum]|uniref:GNAT family N-acetyltransferase n=1 Tax=Marinigracilibium pacificum TaxID=2729599 RepID=A0A848ITG7_9BACT|nr:GNAT family N-acetyltransferase [Marinigracilibium pacificum]NMM47056.1 GNAT family N-acetyltransferase [Marinigracilibium pacificum]
MVEIRDGKIEDIPQVFELVKELALYERAPEEVINSIEEMKIDGFGQDPSFGLIVAEDTEINRIVGIVIYYIRYSTWKGRCLYLEDLIVTENRRGEGHGLNLFNAYVKKGQELGVKQLMWQVLDWNTPAIDFYKKLGANVETEWYNCKVEKEGIETFFDKAAE